MQMQCWQNLTSVTDQPTFTRHEEWTNQFQNLPSRTEALKSGGSKSMCVCVSVLSEVALPKHQVSALFLWDRCQVYPWVTMVKKQ